jgi:hypothetical protein
MKTRPPRQWTNVQRGKLMLDMVRESFQREAARVGQPPRISRSLLNITKKRRAVNKRLDSSFKPEFPARGFLSRIGHVKMKPARY